MAKRKRNYIIKPKDDVILNEVKDPSAKVLRCAQDDKFALLDNIDKLGIDHKELVDPQRRKFLIQSISSSTAISAEMKFSLITGIMTLFTPKTVFSQIIPFAFWRTQTPSDPPVYTFGSLEVFSWGSGSSGAHDQNNTTHYSSPIQISGNFSNAFVGYSNRFLIDDENQCYVVGENGGGKLGIGSTSDRLTKTQLTGSWAQIVGGHTQSLGIRSDGSLWAWGGNAYGQLGQETHLNSRSSPVQIGSDTDWSTVGATIGFTSFAIKQDGTMWTWGRGNYGQHGQSDTINRSSPVQVPGSWKAVEGGWQTVIAIRSDDTLWVWGNNGSGKLGLGGGGNRSSPVQLGAYKWKKVAATEHSQFGLREDDTLWSWGYNGNGDLGDGTTTYRNSPVQVDGIWTDVSAGGRTAGGVKNDGTLWCWGSFTNGNLGESVTTNQSSPVQIGSDSDWTGVEVCAIDFVNTVIGIKGEVQTSSEPFTPINTTQGTLWGWGYGNEGSLGLGGSTNYSSPVQLSGEYFTRAVANRHSSLWLRNDGSLWVTGQGNFGQLGLGNTTDQNSPQNLAGSWIQASAWNEMAIAIKSDNTLWSWGKNSTYGQLGHNNHNNSSSPIQINGGGSWKYSAVGMGHCLAVKTDGTLWAWGDGQYGQLGQVSNLDEASSPIQIGSDSNWAKVGCGYHSLALKDNGSLWIWGMNNFGQVGNGNNNNQSSPIQVPGVWIDIVGGTHNSVGIKSNGYLYTWGRNTNGQIGDNSTTHRNTPVRITNHKWKEVGGHDYSTLAIREDGTLWGWGHNNEGQLGLSDKNNRSSPVQISTSNDWVAIDSAYQALAIREVTTGGSGGATLSAPSQLLATPGYLWGNGYGGHGRLGQETTNVNMSSPVQVAGLWRGISSGGTFNVGIRDDYTLWNWGRNNKGQLGQGNFTNTSSPVQVTGSWIACAAQDEGTFGIRSDGTLWAWGYNSMADGMLGIDNTGINNANSPLQVDGSWTFVAAGAYHGGGIKTDGTLWMWGYARYGCIGDDTNTTRPSPVQIGSGTDWIALHCCDYNTMALKSDYTLWAWGANDHGMLAQPTHNNNESSPVQIDGSWIQFTTAYSAGAGIKTDGTLWVWGWNGTNLLGTGDSTYHSSPVQIAGSWLQVEGDQQCFRAIKNDGTCWVWGEGSTGRLGLNSNADRNTPIQLGNEDDWLKVDSSKYRGQWGIRYAPPQKAYSLWTWGYNDGGNLGVSDRVHRSSPIQVPGEWIHVTMGQEQTHGIKADGTLWTWGWNAYGSLGTNQGYPGKWGESSPVQIAGKWKDVECGGVQFGFAIKSEGTLWSWGLGSYGRTGHGDTVDRSSPVQVGTSKSWHKLAQVGGAYHMGAIDNNGYLWMWGANWNGEIGDGSTTHRQAPVKVGTDKWRHIAAGGECSFGIKLDGTLWAWGYNYRGQLGTNNNTNYSDPVQLGTHTWKMVKSRVHHAWAIRSDDTIWTWGWNSDGQLGLGDKVDRSSPVQVPGYGKSIGTGSKHALLIRSNGSLWTAGRNDRGQLGNGNSGATDETNPVKIGNHEDWALVVGSSYGSSLGLRDNVSSSSHELWVWGWNGYGQLGPNGTVGQNASSPIQIPGNWVKASFGNELILADRADGSHATWGWGAWGMLGHGNTNNLSTPEMLPGEFKEFNTGWNQTLWVRDDGTLWSAGRNQYGQLGIGNTQNQSSPVQIGTDTDWATCDAGETWHCLAIKTDGRLWGWGTGSYGSLANDSLINRSSPIQIAGSWVQARAGTNFSVGIRTDGTLWAWGRNDNGQLGQNSAGDRSSPVQINGSWIQVSTGSSQSIGLKTDYTAWTWGANSWGELGDGTTTNRSSPVQVAGSWKIVAAGDAVFAGIKIDNTLWIWGRNSWGQLGQVSHLNNQSSPVQIPGQFADVQIGSYRNVLALKKKGS